MLLIATLGDYFHLGAATLRATLVNRLIALRLLEDAFRLDEKQMTHTPGSFGRLTPSVVAYGVFCQRHVGDDSLLVREFEVQCM